MGISFDKIDGAAWLTFDVQPSANPVIETERTTKLENPGFGRVFQPHRHGNLRKPRDAKCAHLRRWTRHVRRH